LNMLLSCPPHAPLARHRSTAVLVGTSRPAVRMAASTGLDATDTQCYLVDGVAVDGKQEVICTSGGIQETAWFMGLSEKQFKPTEDLGASKEECELQWSVTGSEEWHCKGDVAEDSEEPENQCYTVEDSTEVVCTTDLQETAWYMGVEEGSFKQADGQGSVVDAEECDLTWSVTGKEEWHCQEGAEEADNAAGSFKFQPFRSVANRLRPRP